MSGAGADAGAADEAARAATLALLAERAVGATICPSEVARALAAGDGGQEGAGADWRARMPAVHAAVDALAAAGKVRLSWKGPALTRRDGPYRIRRAEERISVTNPAPPPPGQRPQDD